MEATFISVVRNVNIGVYVKNGFFKDSITLQVEPKDMPCGLRILRHVRHSLS